MRVRAVAVTCPGAGQQWTFVGNPAAMALAGVPGPQVTTVAAPGARPGRRGRDRPDPGHPR
jgi:hypothetical protein